MDQSKEDLQIISNLIKESGYLDVFAFSTLEEAEASLSSHDLSGIKTIFAIDLAIIDVSLGQPAYRFIEKCRSVVYQDLPVIAMSDGSRSEGMSSSFAYGATDFLIAH